MPCLFLRVKFVILPVVILHKRAVRINDQVKILVFPVYVVVILVFPYFAIELVWISSMISGFLPDRSAPESHLPRILPMLSLVSGTRRQK